MFQKLLEIFQKSVALVMGEDSEMVDSSHQGTSSGLEAVQSVCKILRNSRYSYSLRRTDTKPSTRTANRRSKRKHGKSNVQQIRPKPLKKRRKPVKRITAKRKKKKTSRKNTLNRRPVRKADESVADSTKTVESNQSQTETPSVSTGTNDETSVASSESIQTPPAAVTAISEDQTDKDSNPAGRLAKIFSESVNLELKQRSCGTSGEQNSDSSSTRTFFFYVDNTSEDFSSSVSRTEDYRSESEIQNFSYSSSSESRKAEVSRQLSDSLNHSKSNLHAVSSDLIDSAHSTNIHHLEFYPVQHDETTAK